jgi:hypothetical protein
METLLTESMVLASLLFSLLCFFGEALQELRGISAKTVTQLMLLG